jgi:hypothetical protein
LNCVEIEGGGYLEKNKMHKKEGEMGEGERRVDYQVTNQILLMDLPI